MGKSISIDDTTEVIIHNGSEYFRACAEDDISSGTGIRITFDNEFAELGDLELAIIKDEGKIFAVSNICPHKHAPKISVGIIRNGVVTCPLHAWKYKLDSGENLNTHDGIKKLETYDVMVTNGYIYIERPVPKVPAWRMAEL